MRAALTVAVVLAVGAGVWYALRKRAEAPPAMAEAPEAALAALPPAPAAGAASGAAAPVEAWRARVVRAARSYALALDSAAPVVRPVYSTRLAELRRVAGILEAASTIETQTMLAFRVYFINPAWLVSVLRRDGREREAVAVELAVTELRAAAASSPADSIGVSLAGRTGASTLGPSLGLRVAS